MTTLVTACGGGGGSGSGGDENFSVTVTAATLTEGNSGTTQALFTLELTDSSQSALTANYQTVNGSAAAGSDYVTTSGRVSFTASQRTATVSVPVNGDLIIETDERFFLTVTNASGTMIGRGSVTVLNDDAPDISISGDSVSEGTDTTNFAVFEVSLNEPPTETLTVDYTTTPGTATDVQDYVAASGSIVFAPGETSKEVTVSIVTDSDLEPDEEFFLSLTGSSGGQFVNTSATATIRNDDILGVTIPGITVTDTSIDEDDGAAAVSVTVRMDWAVATSSVFNYATLDGSAVAALGDYTATTGSLTIPAGNTVGTIVVPIIDDSEFEGDESFSVVLTNAAASEVARGDVTLRDNDLPIVTVTAAPATEGNGGSTQMVVTLTLSNPAVAPLALGYATDVTPFNTTPAQSSFVPAASTVSFGVGDQVKTVSLTVVGDTTYEENETFDLAVTHPSGPEIGRGTLTIIDDDLPGFELLGATVAEEAGSIDFTLRMLPHPATIAHRSIDIEYFTSNNTAVAGSDYVAIPVGTLVTFAPGENEKFLTVTINDDTIFEENESFTLHVRGPGASTNIASAIGTINNADAAGVSIASIVPNPSPEGDGGLTQVIVTVAISPAPAGNVVVVYETRETGLANAATTNVDFLRKQTSLHQLTLTPTNTTGLAFIDIIGDTAVEPDESFEVVFSDGNSASPSFTPQTALITIANDDFPRVQFDSGTPVSGDENTLSGTALDIELVDPVSGNRTTQNIDATVELIITGSADAVDDYGTINATPPASVSGSTLTIPAGQDHATLLVPVVADTLFEEDDNIVITLDSPTNAALGAIGQREVEIINDDLPAPTITLSATATTVCELQANGCTAPLTTIVTATMSRAAGFDVTIPFSLGGSSADGFGAPSSTDPDYSLAPEVLLWNIPAGSIQASLTLTTLDDGVFEGNETVIFDGGTISPASVLWAPAGTSNLTVTIQDDEVDPVATVTFTPEPVTEGAASTTRNVTFTVTLSNTAQSNLTFNFATADGTATTADGDYVANSNSRTYTPGQTEKTFTVTVNGDDRDEGDNNLGAAETFTVNFTSTDIPLFVNAPATVHIVDDDAPPTVSWNRLSSTLTPENGQAALQMDLSAASGLQVSVPFSITGTGSNPASAGDYALTSPVSSPLVFSPGVSSLSILIDGVNDSVDEFDEGIEVTIGSPTNASLSGGATHTLRIADDDAAPVVSIGDVTVTEGDNGDTPNATFNLTLSAASEKTVQVTATTAPGSAAAGADYTHKQSTVIFSSLATTNSFSVVVIGDDLDEEDTETFTVGLTAPSNATVSPTNGTGTGSITDDDLLPSVAWSTAASSHAESGAVAVSATLSAISGRDVTVPFTPTGDAVIPSDYTISSSPLVISALASSASVTVTVQPDDIDEPDETVVLTIGTPINASKGLTDVHTLTILDNDPEPVISINSPNLLEPAAGTDSVNFVLSLSKPSGRTVTVNYATADGTATVADTDYVALGSATATFNPGDTSVTIPVTVNSTGSEVADENMRLALTSPMWASLASTAGFATIYEPSGDVDADGMPDSWEASNTLSAADGDEDADGVTNLEEFLCGTDPQSKVDSDGDGFSDDFEICSYGTAIDEANDRDIDTDSDGYADYDEYINYTDLNNSASHPYATETRKGQALLAANFVYVPGGFDVDGDGSAESGFWVSKYEAKADAGSITLTAGDTVADLLQEGALFNNVSKRYDARLCRDGSDTSCVTNNFTTATLSSVIGSGSVGRIKFEAAGVPLSSLSWLEAVAMLTGSPVSATATLQGLGGTITPNPDAGFTYEVQLPSEAQWMQMVQVAVNNTVNWSDATVNSGLLNPGHTDGAPASLLAANADDLQNTDGTGTATQIRTLRMDNGVFNVLTYTGTVGSSAALADPHVDPTASQQTVWDLAGNVAEWTSGLIAIGDRFNTGNLNDWDPYQNLNNSGPTMPAWLKPATAAGVVINGNKNTGYFLGATSSSTAVNTLSIDGEFAAVVRGGAFNDGLSGSDFNAGLSAANMDKGPGFQGATVGFRGVVNVDGVGMR